MRNRLFWLCVLCAWMVCNLVAQGQQPDLTISRIDIKYVGPADVSETLIRANISSRVGETYMPITADDDVRNLYKTGLFYNIRVTRERGQDGGVVLTFIVQANPRLIEIKIEGNNEIRLSKIKKKITSKIGEPLDERKLFTDMQAVRELYEKSGYPGTKVEYKVSIPDDNVGRGSVTFKITESPKTKITSVEFIGEKAFTQKQLGKQIKTRPKNMWSWLTRKGYFKQDQFEDDEESLKQFYRDKGYIDFEIKDVKFENPTTNTIAIKITIFEGRLYKVGSVTFKGTTMLATNAISRDFKPGPGPLVEQMTLNRNFRMKPGDTFTESGLSKDLDAVKTFYDSKGYIDVGLDRRNLNVRKFANTDTGTMDLQFEVNEGQKSYVEKIEIRGNHKTKDRVIRRELSIAPGEVFDMTRVKVSQTRLEGLGYFEDGRVDVRPETTDVPNRKNLVINVEEKNTGNFSVGAGFSSVDSIVGFVELTQGNFDLMHPPTFTGGGQKLRLRIQIGTERQDYQLSFVEPWFLDRKLALSVDLYHSERDFQSLNDLYLETRTGMKVGLTRTLGSDFLIGNVSYTIENVGIELDNNLHGWIPVNGGFPPFPPTTTYIPPNAPSALLKEEGDSLATRIGAGLAYDTRNSPRLPDAGQRTELSTELTTSYLGGERDYYKVELQSAWYFRGLSAIKNMPKGHVFEIVGRIGVADGFNGDDVPFYDRWYLGGLNTLRGYEYRSVSPREQQVDRFGNPLGTYFSEPIGGNTYLFGSIEYSIPLIQKDTFGGVRLAVFYDIGKVNSDAYDFDMGDYSDNWGIGLRLNLPIGPLRLDYGVPINTDRFNRGADGRFQFGVGYSRPL